MIEMETKYEYHKPDESLEPYQDLANAIVIQAVKDYRSALQLLKQKPQNKKAKGTALEIERFFHSAWYRKLTEIDSDELINRLRKEAA